LRRAKENLKKERKKLPKKKFPAQRKIQSPTSLINFIPSLGVGRNPKG
jgi:hypothetical protein